MRRQSRGQASPGSEQKAQKPQIRVGERCGILSINMKVRVSAQTRAEAGLALDKFVWSPHLVTIDRIMVCSLWTFSALGLVGLGLPTSVLILMTSWGGPLLEGLGTNSGLYPAPSAHLRAWWTGSITGPTKDLLKQNVHFNKVIHIHID